jgi:hypothetical protein
MDGSDVETAESQDLFAGRKFADAGTVHYHEVIQEPN